MRRLITITALAAAVLAATAGGASARVLPGTGSWFTSLTRLPAATTVTARTRITNDPDNGHGVPAEWAADTITRTVKVTRGASVPAGECGLTSGSCWAYSAALTDSGSFKTRPGAGTPNQSCAGCGGLLVRSPALRGSLSGTYSVTFYASSGTPSASLVPRRHDDGGVAAVPPYTPTTWAELFFPAGTSFGGLTGGAYEWDYTAIPMRFPFITERWADSSADNDGNSPGAGNIAG